MRAFKRMAPLVVAGLLVVVTAIQRVSAPPEPRQVELLCGLARLYARSGEYDRSIRLYEQLMRESGRPPYVRLGLAASCYAQGDYARAERQYRILLDQDPESAVPLYNLGQTLLRRGTSAEGRLYLSEFVARHGAGLPVLAERAMQELAADPWGAAEPGER